MDAGEPIAMTPSTSTHTRLRAVTAAAFVLLLSGMSGVAGAATGNITTVAGDGTNMFKGDNGPATSASLNFPTATALIPNGGYYIADQVNQRVRRVDAAGSIITVAGNGNAGFEGDFGPAVSARLNAP